MLEINIRLLIDAKIPDYATSGSSGMDLYAYSPYKPTIILPPFVNTLVSAGIHIEIPEGYEGQIRSKSGLAVKSSLIVLNSPGTIDSDYRGEVKVILYNAGKQWVEIKHQDKIAQIVFAPVIKANLIITERLEDTLRGEGGFGSTGDR